VCTASYVKVFAPAFLRLKQWKSCVDLVNSCS